jgi:hypothetical protein
MVLNRISAKDIIAAAKVAVTRSRFASIIRSNAWRHMGWETSRGLENQTLTGDDDRGARLAMIGPQQWIRSATTEGDRKFWRQIGEIP